MKKELKKIILSAVEKIRQIEIDTNSDDKTISELLAEDVDPNYKFPYSDSFIKKYNLKK